MQSSLKLDNVLLQAMKAIQPVGPYNIAGYSLGACVAIEICLQLAALQPYSEPLKSLHLLDGSHTFVSMYTEMYRMRKDISDEKTAETEALCTFVQQFTTIEYSDVRNLSFIVPICDHRNLKILV